MRYKIFICEMESFLLLKHFKCQMFRIKQDKAKRNRRQSLVSQLQQRSPYLACTTVNSNVGSGDFSLVLGSLHVCVHAHVRSHVFQSMDWVGL